MKTSTVIALTVVTVIVGVLLFAQHKTEKPVEAQVYSLKIPVLMYHRFINCPASSDMYTCADITVEPQQFADEMKYLHDNGYQTLTLDQVQFLKDNQMQAPQKSVVITFDDAYNTQYSVAYPILKQYNLTANLFIPSGLLNQNGIMTSAQAQEMQRTGNAVIYGHTVNHNNWRTAVEANDSATMTTEITESKTFLEALGVRKIIGFAYPTGARSALTVSLLQNAGYKQAYITCLAHCSDIIIGMAGFTNDVIGSQTAQTITVSSTAHLSVNSLVKIADNPENVVVLSIPSATTFTAIVKNNHAQGQQITWNYSVRAPVNSHFADFTGDMFGLERRTVYPKITIDNFIGLLTQP